MGNLSIQFHQSRNRSKERSSRLSTSNNKSNRDGDKNRPSSGLYRDGRENRRSSDGRDDGDNSHDKKLQDDAKSSKSNVNKMVNDIVHRPSGRRDQKNRKFINERDSTNQGDDSDDSEDSDYYLSLRNENEDNDDDLSKYDLSDLVESNQKIL